MEIKNSVILITGASSGIGRALAMRFDREGARVAIAARRRELLESAAAEMKNPLVIPADLSDENQSRDMVKKTVEQWGRIDVLINNAAAIMVSPLEEIHPDDMTASLKTNLLGPMAAVNEAARYMKEQKHGHIINVGSPSFMMGLPYYGPYVISKGAVSAWTRTLQAEWHDTGIVVSEYFPGYIKTDSASWSRQYGSLPQDLVLKEKRSLMDRLFIRAKSTDAVAEQFVRLVRRPKPVKHSGFMVALGTLLALVPAIRRSIAMGIGGNVKSRLESRD